MIFSTKNIKVFNTSKAICNKMKRKHHRQFSQIVINVEQDRSKYCILIYIYLNISTSLNDVCFLTDFMII